MVLIRSTNYNFLGIIFKFAIDKKIDYDNTWIYGGKYKSDYLNEVFKTVGNMFDNFYGKWMKG